MPMEVLTPTRHVSAVILELKQSIYFGPFHLLPQDELWHKLHSTTQSYEFTRV